MGTVNNTNTNVTEKAFDFITTDGCIITVRAEDYATAVKIAREMIYG